MTLSLNSNEFNIEGCDVAITNDTTGDVIETATGGVVSYVTPGYTYTASARGITGYGFTNKTKKFTVTTDDLLAGSKAVAFDIEIKSVYKATGKITGFEEGYDTSKLVLTLVPDAESMADTVTATVGADLSFEATLEPDVEYTANISGVNDYEITAGGTFNDSKDITQDVTVAMKSTYTVTGNIVGGANVAEIAFVNVDDGYSYAGSIKDNTYTVILRAGSYEVKAVAEGYTTSGHVVVENKNVSKDILFVPVTVTPPTVDTSVKDIYVGCEGQVNNFATMSEALEAAKVMNPQSEADRVTIHIAPGTYREQLIITTPYITLKPEGNGEVKLTWYYGIGYRYYSVDETGYYNVENAFDKYSKEVEAAKWGVGTYVKNTATGFKAENITFEASFNKYITDEEIADGVEETGILPARTYALDVTSKAATERSTALIVEADRSEFKNCTMIGSQDTLYMGDSTHTYYKNCKIEGNTDYIFGSGNAVFDGCELRFCGYSDTGMGGYITAGRSNNKTDYVGYIFRDCTISNKDGMKHASGYFGRPWDAGADIAFINTVVENADAISAEGWTSMSGVAPTAAKYKEYNTILADGTPVDTTGRVTGVMEEAAAKDLYTNAKTAYLGWDPTYYTESGTPVFSTDPYWSTDGDVLLPHTGDTFIVKYSLGDNDANDASRITYALIAADGTETVIKNTTAQANTGVKLTADMIGSKLKATVTPYVVGGLSGEAKSTVTEKEISLGSGTIDTDRPSGKAVIFLAGDSTVKDYSAGAINNSGANLNEGSWGEFLGYFVDNSKYEVMDYAQGGRSARTFMNGTKADGSDKYLDMIKEKMVKGDYLFIQFGHNDSSASYADRYVPVGTPDASGKFPYTPQSDTTDSGTGSFCWYLQQYVDAAKAVGATPVLVTPVSRMYFESDGTIRSHHGDNDEYVTATKQVAEDNNILCIDLYSWTKAMYEDAYKTDSAAGNIVSGDYPSPTAARLFSAGEKTHHSKLGGFAIAADMAEMIQNSSLGFANAITAPKSMYIADAKGNTEFIVNNSGVFTGYGKNAEGDFDTSIPCEYWNTYINGALAKLADTPVDNETTTETTTEAVVSDYIGIEPVVVSNEGGKLVVDYNVVNGTGKGFNNYMMFFTFNPDLLTPVSVAEGDIAIDIIDASGAQVKANAANAANIENQFANVPASGNKDFPNADGVKTQSELGKIKVSYCIFDKDFSQAPNSSLPAFTDSGRLFTVTYDVKGDLSGSSLATINSVIEAVSSNSEIVYTPNEIRNYTYTFDGEAPTETTTEAAPSGLDQFLTDTVKWDIKSVTAGTDLGNGLTALIDLNITTDLANVFNTADGNAYEYSKAASADNCIAAADNGDAISFKAPSNGTFSIAFKISSNKNGNVFGEAFDAQTSSTYYYREYPVTAGQTYTAGVTGSKIRIFYMGFTPSGTIETTEATTEAATSASTEATTTAPEESTEATTSAPTEGTTSAPVTEAPVETSTRRVSTSGGGAGASYIRVEGYTAKTTAEAATEETTKTASDDGDNKVELPFIKVVVDSKDIVVEDSTYTMDVAPYIQPSSNSTMVPLRFVAIAIAGGDVEKADSSDIVVWDSVAKTATIKAGNITAVFTAGSNVVVINGVEAPMNYGVVAEIKDSRMFVPFRVIGEALDATVDWDADEKAAYYNK